MATIKNIPDSYTVNVPSMTINGNLNVLGNTTTIHSTQLSVDDNIITLNGNVTGTPTLNAGLQINRGTSANVYLQWTESVQAWQITNDGINFGNILTLPGGNLTLSANVYLQNTISTPPALAGYSALYAKTPGAGGTGLYVSNSAYINEELMIKRRSIAYSILFGQ